MKDEFATRRGLIFAQIIGIVVGLATLVLNSSLENPSSFAVISSASAKSDIIDI